MKKVEIHVGDLRCKIRGDAKNKAIGEARSYFKMGRDSYSRRYNKNLPKYRYMVTQNGSFHTGILDFVVDYLVDKDFEVRTIDERTVQREPSMEEIEEGLSFVPYTLRPYQKDAVAHGVCDKRGIFNMATGAGKAQPLESTVYTPDGPVKMGEIQPGDYVMTPDGDKTLVVDTFPQGKKDVYRVKFDDGSEVECTENHLWETSSRTERFRYMTVGGEKNKVPQSSVKTLLEIKNSLRYESGENSYKNHSVKVCKPVQFEKNDLKIPPYSMGALLGDGSFRHSVRFSNVDSFILDKVEEELQTSVGDVTLNCKGQNDYNLVDNSEWKNRVQKYLEDFGLFGHYSYEKFIPDEYLYSSLRDRIELLQGLMDTDGTRSDDSRSPSFTTTSKKLAGDVQELVESLGGKVTCSSRVTNYVYDGKEEKGRESYRLRLKLPNFIDCFSLPRKKCKGEKTKSYKPMRYIDAVEYIGKKECQCIKVLDKGSLYLTENFVPTHNTVILSALISIWWQDNTLILIDSVDLAKQLQEEISEVIDYKVGFIGDGIFNPKKVTVGIDRTLSGIHAGKRKEARIKEYLKTIRHLIYDECHHLQSKTWRKISRWCKNATIRHGFSATPITASYETVQGDEDNKNLFLYAYAGPIIFERGLSELVEKGWLAEPKINMVRHDLYWDNNPYENYNEEYERIVIRDEERNDKIAKIAKKHFRQDEQVVGFVDRIEHGKRIKRKLENDYNVGERGVEFVSGQDIGRVRDRKIDDFKEGSLPILIGTVLEEGLNFFCDAGINIAGNKFEKTVYQRMGRCLRKSSTNPETGDIDPDVYESIEWYDFTDSEHKWFEKQANQRAEAYMKEDLDISIIKEGGL